jgi:pyruvate-ferredoxin/flavodoxin oxidoreductase
MHRFTFKRRINLQRPTVTIDGNEAAAYVAHRVNEVIAIYPITPSSTMGELSDQWSSAGSKNIWGSVPTVVEMQSEGGAAGAVHGALQAGSLTTTFTSSQGLLLMIPNMYKIAGELTPTVFHVAARAIAAQGLSIFGDHQDVMAVRATGFGLLSSHSVQSVMDMALIAHASALESRIPFVHFFDGFRTSHEVAKVEQLTEDDMRSMIRDELVRAHRMRSLNPDRPVLRGTAQNPDVYFQSRETVNPYYDACPEIVQRNMDRLAALTGRQYRLYDYSGAPDAERVIVLMGSATTAAEECAAALIARGEKVGVLNVHLFRPLSVGALAGALPQTTQAIAVLDRTKEPGSAGEPLYQDVVTAVREAGTFPHAPLIIGGRYGLASKEFTPAMAAAVFAELDMPRPRNHFVVGINDDVSHLSLDFDPDFSTEDPETVRAIFYGLGADGTVGANKNSIKIIGEDTENYAQGYFVYDSKKSGAVTVSHLRFGRKPIGASYLITRASFVACHQFSFLERMDVLDLAEPGATFLLNSPYDSLEVWDHLPESMQRTIIDKQLKFFVIDAYKVAKDNGMGGRINTVMQTCFFALSGVLPREEAIAAIKKTIYKTYGKRGEAVVEKNYAAVDNALENLFEVPVHELATSTFSRRRTVAEEAPEFVQRVLAPMMQGSGDDLPVSAFPVDGTYPTGTSKWEKRNLAQEIPVWDEAACIQCGKCVMVCPHAVIRAKLLTPDHIAGAPEGFKTAPARWKDRGNVRYTLQTSPEDCTGCTLCVQVCPAKSKADPTKKALNMAPQAPIREREGRNWDFFLDLPEVDRSSLALYNVKDIQLLQPLFEFPGACAGCGETPYIKLLTQLFGDHTVIANATGCSSIFGGNLPTTPYTINHEGRGPAWSNSLFEDNAEFGLGIRVSLDKQSDYAREILKRLAPQVGEDLVQSILDADQSTEAGIEMQRARVATLAARLETLPGAEALDLKALTSALVRKSVWLIGGDGWAYDIGYGGLDHVFASGRNVKILVLDTEVYSNTGGQASKSTPRGAVAKFAAGGKRTGKKDLGMMAMTYGTVYVAHVSIGGNDTQALKAFLEAEAYDGPALIIGYGHCIAHGIDMAHGLEQQKAAVQSAYWPLFRYNPALSAVGKNPFQLDSRPPAIPLEKYAYNEGRYTMLQRSSPETAALLLAEAQNDVNLKWKMYEQWAAMPGATV